MRRKPSYPAGDAFTLLCRKELGVRCEKEWKFHPVRRWRFDYAFPDFRVALEVEGGVFTGGRQGHSVFSEIWRSTIQQPLWGGQ